MTVSKLPEDYGSLLIEVKERIRAARYRALRAVNKELVGLYRDIGRMIVERQAGDTWGKSIVQQLVGDLQEEFPGIGGFSASNLWRMKSFLRHMPVPKNWHKLCEKLAGVAPWLSCNGVPICWSDGFT